MAALYLHNAIFIPEASQEKPLPHTRTVSSSTFRTVTSDSHPTEPLLNTHPDYRSLAFQDLLTRQPTHPDGPEASWGMRLSFQGLPPTKEERREVAQLHLRRRLRLLKRCLIALQMVIAIWATYNVVRYFIAIKVYSTASGQALAVSMGSASLITLLYLLCANLANAFQEQLVRRDIPLQYVRTTETLFRWLASFFLLTPAVTNFILVFLFKANSIVELEVMARCDLDADVIWSVTRHPCQHPDSQMAWAAWVGVATVRLILTIVVVGLLHSALYSYHALLRHPDNECYKDSPLSQRRRHKLRRTHTHSSSTSHLSSPRVSMVSANSINVGLLSPAPIPAPMRSPGVGSSSPLPISRSPSDNGSRHSPQQPSCSAFSNQPNPTSTPNLDQCMTGGDAQFKAPDSVVPLQNNVPSPPDTTGAPSDRDVHQFVDQFNSLVSQISQEAEEVLSFAQPDSEFNPYANSYDMGPKLPSAMVGSDEFGQPYRADEHISFLNGYVRRMPTIESIGSRELDSMRSLKSMEWEQEQERTASLDTLSRPPTQLTMRTTTTDYGCVINGGLGGSNPPSRANSLNWVGTPTSPFPDTASSVDSHWPPTIGSSVHDSSHSPIAPPAVAYLRRGSSISTNNSGESGSEPFSCENGDRPRSLQAPPSATSPTFPNHPYRTASPVAMQ